MEPTSVIKTLKNELKFSESSIKKLRIYHDSILEFNKRYNLISKSTEKTIWFRHILDSAQIVRFLDSKSTNKIADFGSGAGFPGLVVGIFSSDSRFHVKLYEKSPVKRAFLRDMKDKLNLKNVEIKSNIYEGKIESNIIVCRAFKKLSDILKISREIIKKPHKMIILKGKNAQSEINNVSLGMNYRYKLRDSMTDHDSKIILVDVK